MSLWHAWELLQQNVSLCGQGKANLIGQLNVVNKQTVEEGFISPAVRLGMEERTFRVAADQWCLCREFICFLSTVSSLMGPLAVNTAFVPVHSLKTSICRVSGHHWVLAAGSPTSWKESWRGWLSPTYLGESDYHQRKRWPKGLGENTLLTAARKLDLPHPKYIILPIVIHQRFVKCKTLFPPCVTQSFPVPSLKNNVKYMQMCFKHWQCSLWALDRSFNKHQESKVWTQSDERNLAHHQWWFKAQPSRKTQRKWRSGTTKQWKVNEISN